MLACPLFTEGLKQMGSSLLFYKDTCITLTHPVHFLCVSVTLRKNKVSFPPQLLCYIIMHRQEQCECTYLFKGMGRKFAHEKQESYYHFEAIILFLEEINGFRIKTHLSN